MRYLSRYLPSLMLVAVMTGCAGTASIPLQLTRYRSVLDYYAWVAAADTEALNGELDQLQATAASDPGNTENAVRMALVLGTRNEADDRQQALDLLHAVAENPPLLPVTGSEYLILGQLWADYLQTGTSLVAEQDAHLHAMAELQKQKRDYEALLQQILQQDEVLSTMQRNSRLLENQNSLLQQQLEALTDIEQQLMDRGSEDDGEE
jgi:predicted nucleic acid-binding protein